MGKGMKPESVNQLLAKFFTVPARREADKAKFIRGKVYTACQSNFQADLDAIEHGWMDVAKGMPHLKRMEYE